MNLSLNLRAVRRVRFVLRQECPVVRRRTEEHRGDLDPVRRLLTRQQRLIVEGSASEQRE